MDTGQQLPQLLLFPPPTQNLVREISYHSIVPSFEQKLFYLFLDIHKGRVPPPTSPPSRYLLKSFVHRFPFTFLYSQHLSGGAFPAAYKCVQITHFKKKKKRLQSSLYHLYLVSVFTPFTVWLLKEQSSSSPLSLLNSLQLPIPLQNIPKNVLKRSSIAS